MGEVGEARWGMSFLSLPSDCPAQFGVHIQHLRSRKLFGTLLTHSEQLGGRTDVSQLLALHIFYSLHNLLLSILLKLKSADDFKEG